MKPTAHLEQLIIVTMQKLHKELFNKANKAFDREGFPIQVEQLPVLMCCYYSGDISQQEIADLSGRDKSSIQRTITYFLKHGLASIVSDPADKRKNIVRLSEAGTRLGKQIEEGVEKMEKVFFEGKITPEEKETFLNLARKINRIIAEG